MQQADDYHIRISPTNQGSCSHQSIRSMGQVIIIRLDLFGAIGYWVSAGWHKRSDQADKRSIGASPLTLSDTELINNNSGGMCVPITSPIKRQRQKKRGDHHG